MRMRIGRKYEVLIPLKKCNCDCHRQPGTLHIVACCDGLGFHSQVVIATLYAIDEEKDVYTFELNEHYLVRVGKNRILKDLGKDDE